MEECCAVCAEPLEWLAYGPCGHREVCSTCTSRLRFILNDKNCCICKQECPSVVVTKALGDYTNSVGDFSTLPAGANEGKVGDYWFHLDTQAYFDDEQHYKMIKAMCRLSCSVCNNTCGAQEPGKELQKRDREFKHIDQLRKHLFHVHKLSMCILCLEGRKVFISEQKLYTRAQLERHLSRGDTEVDGNEIERGGFMGHPICDFCRKRFYGDNELYLHMSRDHYTCHICQRRHPEHFEYYRNYSDLEAHFSQEHFLCENADCLAKKFVVFASEAELKRHNAIEHAGNMSRSQRNAALQIPVSFQYRRPGSERESHRVARGRGRNMNNRFSAANPASSEMFDIQNAIHESMLTASAGNFNSGESPDPVPSLLSSDMVASSSTSRALNSPLEESAFPPLPGVTVSTDPPRYLTAVSRRALNSPLEESAFPPLPGVTENALQKSRNKGKRSNKSMAALVRGGQGNARVLNAAESRRSLGPGRHSPSYPVNSSSNQTNGNRNVNYSSRPTVVNSQEPVPNSDEFPPMAALVRGGQGNIRVLNAAESRNSFGPGQLSSLYPVNSSLNQINGNRNVNYSSRPTVVNSQEPVPNSDEFPPILGRHHVPAASATENQGQGPSNTPLLSEEMRAANKALTESILSGLGGNVQQFAAFKDISAQFRNGGIGARKYYSHISKRGLSHLVPGLASLCPDQDKQRELLEAHEARLKKNSQLAVNQVINQTGEISIRSGSIDNHRKGKTVVVGSSKDVTSSSNADSGRSLGKPSDEVEVLSKDGYRTAKGKAKPWEIPALNRISGTSGCSEEPADNCQRPPPLTDSLNSYSGEKWTCNACSLLNKPESSLCLVCETERPDGLFMKEPSYGGKGKQKKKASKAQRVNLDDGLASTESNQSSSASSVWGNGGGQRLVSITQR